MDRKIKIFLVYFIGFVVFYYLMDALQFNKLFETVEEPGFNYESNFNS